MPRKAKLYLDGYHFDSKWELAFYIKNKDEGKKIFREPIKIPYLIDNKKHYYKPDFRIDDTYYEIKGTYDKDTEWFLTPYERLEIGNNEDLLQEALRKLNIKRQVALDNKITIIGYKEICPYLEYCEKKYKSKKWHELFRGKENPSN